MRPARTAVAVAAMALGGLLAVGCALAILFELQGFGRPRDTDVRIGYLLALVVALPVCLGVPLWLWRGARR